MRSRGVQISMALVCLMLGIMLSVQFKTTRYYNASMVLGRAEDLASQINTATKEKKALEQKVDSLSEQLNTIKNKKNEQAMVDLQKDLQNADLYVGLVKVEGPGIRIELNDKPRDPNSEDNPNIYLVHDSDLLMVVNDLKGVGAEAIAINGQRITATSEIRCGGTLILINQTAIGPPFIIQAIGNQDELYGAMLSKSSGLELLKVAGMLIKIDKVDKVTLPAARGIVKKNSQENS